MNLTLSSLLQPQDDVRVIDEMSKSKAEQKEASLKSLNENVFRVENFICYSFQKPNPFKTCLF